MGEQIRQNEYEMFKKGYIRQWELTLKNFRRQYQARFGREPTGREMDDVLAQNIHMQDWVLDPEAVAAAQPQHTKEEIKEIQASLYELPGAKKMFNTFIERSGVDA